MFIAASYNLWCIANNDRTLKNLLDDKIYNAIDKVIVSDNSNHLTMKLSGKFIGKILWYLCDIDRFKDLNSKHLITLTSTSKYIHELVDFDNFEEMAKDLFRVTIDDRTEIEQVIKHVVKLKRPIHSKYKLTFVTTDDGRGVYYDCVIKALADGKTELSVDCYSFYFTFVSIRSMLIDLFNSTDPRGKELLEDLELLSAKFVKNFEFTEQTDSVLFKLRF